MLTDSTGRFEVTVPPSAVFLYYNIAETNPPGYYSTGAVAGPGGSAITADWIQYSGIPEGTYAGTRFYDHPMPTATPTGTPTPTPTVTPTPTATATPTATSTPSGAIPGIVWEDANRSGTLDWGENGIGNVTVDLYRDEDGSGGLSAADTYLTSTTTTGPDGWFAFANLPRGRYLVAVTDRNRVLDNHRRTTPAGPIGVDLGPDQQAADVLFGYVQPPLYRIYVPVVLSERSLPASGLAAAPNPIIGGRLP
jgi:hypothetical protein